MGISRHWTLHGARCASSSLKVRRAMGGLELRFFAPWPTRGASWRQHRLHTKPIRTFSLLPGATEPNHVMVVASLKIHPCATTHLDTYRRARSWAGDASESTRPSSGVRRASEETGLLGGDFNANRNHYADQTEGDGRCLAESLHSRWLPTHSSQKPDSVSYHAVEGNDAKCRVILFQRS